MIQHVGSKTSHSLVGKVHPGEKVVALVRKLDCTAMTDTQIAEVLFTCKDEPGRILCVRPTPASSPPIRRRV